MITGGSSLPDILKKRIAALPRNRHGARAAQAIIRRYVNGLNAARVSYAAKKANRREARRTPSMRISDRRYDEFVDARDDAFVGVPGALLIDGGEVAPT